MRFSNLCILFFIFFLHFPHCFVVFRNGFVFFPIIVILKPLILFATGSFLQKSAKLFFRRRHQRKEPGMSQSHNDLVYLESPAAVERASRSATLTRMLGRKSKSKSKANGSTLTGEQHAQPSLPVSLSHSYDHHFQLRTALANVLINYLPPIPGLLTGAPAL